MNMTDNLTDKEKLQGIQDYLGFAIAEIDSSIAKEEDDDRMESLLSAKRLLTIVLQDVVEICNATSFEPEPGHTLN